MSAKIVSASTTSIRVKPPAPPPKPAFKYRGFAHFMDWFFYRDAGFSDRPAAAGLESAAFIAGQLFARQKLVHHPRAVHGRFRARRAARAQAQAERKNLQQGDHAQGEDRERDQDFDQGETRRGTSNPHGQSPRSTSTRPVSASKRMR